MTAQTIYSTLDTWEPRHYYVKRNKTSGKLYVGQTTDNIETYLGTGSYWINHCKKHGGYNKDNIENVWFQWFENEDEALEFLNSFEEQNPNYYVEENKVWANQVPEHTLDKTSAFAFQHVIEKRNKTIADSEWRATVLVDKTKRMVETRKTTIRPNGLTVAQDASRKGADTVKSQEWKDENYIECEHCSKIVDPGNYGKWHGDKCKENPNSTAEVYECNVCEMKTRSKTNYQRHLNSKKHELKSIITLNNK